MIYGISPGFGRRAAVRRAHAGHGVYTRAVRALVILVVLFANLVACTPAPVLNPNKNPKHPGRPEVQRDVTLGEAPEAVVHKRDGSTIDLATLWHDKKVLVVFYRGGWCPHCQKQFAELQDHYKDFDEAEVTVLGISSDSTADATALREKLSLGFELYSDPDLAVITKWGVEDYGAGISRPATFVIQPGGAITYRKVGENPADHPSMAELLAAIH